MTIKETSAWWGRLAPDSDDPGADCPIKINPWTALAKAIGKAVNADVFNRLSEIESKLDEHIKTDDPPTADNCRGSNPAFQQ